MVRKYCPKCGKYSYSACAEGIWVCPTCGYDLSQMPVLNLNEKSPDTTGHQDKQ